MRDDGHRTTGSRERERDGSTNLAVQPPGLRGTVRRLSVALGIGTVVFGGVYGLASSLGVNGQTLGAGSASIAACQSATLTTSYATAYDATIPGYKVGVVTVTGLDTTSMTNCASKAFKVTITGTGNASLGQVTGTTPSSGTSFTADFTSNAVAASAVLGVHIAITG
jgi:hypothetical protein